MRTPRCWTSPVARDRNVTGLGSLLVSVFGGKDEGMARRGEIVLDGETLALYLPEKAPGAGKEPGGGFPVPAGKNAVKRAPGCAEGGPPRSGGAEKARARAR